MKWKDGKPNDSTLVALAIISIAIFLLAEKTATPERQPHFDRKLAAAKHAMLAREAIREYSANLGITTDVQNDPFHTGLIGQEKTEITSDRGVISSKILAANPNFAAAFVDMLLKAKVKKGSVVAVGMTGSLPGFNVSFLAACQALELKPIIITSVGSSDWGANNPMLTWLDMERILNDRGVMQFRSVAASYGGGADNGRGLSPHGRELIRDAVERNGVRLIDEPSLEANIARRMALYDSLAHGEPIAMYVNIGGGIASLGGTQNARIVPPGLTEHLAVKNFPVRSVIVQMAEKGLPVANLLKVEKIADRYDIPTEIDTKEPELGEGTLYFKDRYSVSNVAVLTVILGILVFTVIRIDVKHYLFRKKSPIA